MTSEERRQGRYLRRKQKRMKFLDKQPSYDEVFTWKNMMICSHKSTLKVGWKASTQTHKLFELRNVAKLMEELKDRKYKLRPFAKFYIKERGKVRFIQSCHIRDRIVQKCFVDFFLMDVIRPKLIYDNGACLKGKGVSFTRKRLKRHLDYIKKTEGGFDDKYIVIMDIKSFFDSICHSFVIQMVNNAVKDGELLTMYSMLVSAFDGEAGLGLGSQISQISATFYLNRFDHFVKDKLAIKCYSRYMDDSYFIINDKQEAHTYVDEIDKICSALKLKLNRRKTSVIKLGHGFTFLKRKYCFSKTVYVTASPEIVIRQRRKIKSMSKSERFTKPFVLQSLNSWKSCLLKTSSFKRYQNMELLVNKLWR